MYEPEGGVDGNECGRGLAAAPDASPTNDNGLILDHIQYIVLLKAVIPNLDAFCNIKYLCIMPKTMIVSLVYLKSKGFLFLSNNIDPLSRIGHNQMNPSFLDWQARSSILLLTKSHAWSFLSCTRATVAVSDNLAAPVGEIGLTDLLLTLLWIYELNYISASAACLMEKRRNFV